MSVAFDQRTFIDHEIARFKAEIAALEKRRAELMTWDDIDSSAINTLAIEGVIYIKELARDIAPDIDYATGPDQFGSSLSGHFYVPKGAITRIKDDVANGEDVIFIGIDHEDCMLIQNYIKEVLESEIAHNTDVSYIGLHKDDVNPYELEIIYRGTTLDGDRARVEFDVRVA